tara:strand:- start:54 stop:704 length:651 start_codon:yes stop_codon:yes gene_type:complete
MNIFALSRNPFYAAEQMIDKHVVKMPTETCQMLHTNILYMEFIKENGFEPQLKDLKKFHKELDSELMKPAMLNHPSTIWARKSIHNFRWLLNHGDALCKEYTFRYGKEHGAQKRIVYCAIYGDTINNYEYSENCLTPVDIAMFDKYRIPNETGVHNWDYVIKSYRHYYLEGKWRFAAWRKNRRPEWYPENWYAVQFNKEVRSFNERNNGNLKLMEE